MRAAFYVHSLPMVFKALPHIAEYYRLQAEELSLYEGEDITYIPNLWGGEINLVETKDEANQILRDEVDVFRQHPAHQDYWEVMVFNNNSGGPTYVIPKDFVDHDAAFHLINVTATGEANPNVCHCMYSLIDGIRLDYKGCAVCEPTSST